MNRRSFALVCAPYGEGATDSRCAEGPATLRRLISATPSLAVSLATEETVWPCGEDAHGFLNRLMQRTEHLAARHRLLILSGDHSCAAGVWRGVSRAVADDGHLGLIWVDAHLDSHTRNTSPSGARHGMPLAALLGHGEAALCQFDAPLLQPQYVCVIGARSFEPEEAALLMGLGVRVFSMAEIRKRGLATIMAEAVTIAGKARAGYGLSLDVDAMDPHDAPGTGSPVTGGIGGRELELALHQVAEDPRLLAIEIAEFNPALDVDDHTARCLLGLLGTLLVRQPEDLPAMENQFGAHNYGPVPVVLSRGEGVWLWDEDGHRYLDMMSAYSAVSLGHGNARIRAALQRQAGQLAVTSRAYFNDRLPPFLKRLCELTGMDRALPVNTGLEAVETALKAARKWGHVVKGIADGEQEIIACDGNFHGRSIAIISLSSETQYRKGFGPFPPGMKRIPYADADALEAAITPKTVAFLVEPIQGEGGIIVPPDDYLRRCAEICRHHRVLLIADEIQTGLCRTGSFLACDQAGIKPDGLTLGKALGGGVLPVSAFLASEEVMAVFQPGDHGSTFGGNALSSAVAHEALNCLTEGDLGARAGELGVQLMDALHLIDSPLIRDVRGRGLLIGVEIDTQRMTAWDLCLKLMAHGILSKDTHDTVLRFAPPLTISDDELAWGIARIRETFADADTGWPHAA